MIKIVPIRHSDIKKIKKMIEYVTPGISPDVFDDRCLTHFPFNVIHGILPVNLKFLQECYVAVEDDEPLGLISLEPDGHTKNRWKINRLVLGINAYDIGKQLIDYVVNKYGGAGVEIFITVIDENYPEAIALFQKACSFRHYSKINIWKYENPYELNLDIKYELFRRPVLPDSQKLLNLDTEAIFPHLRVSLVKTVDDFKLNLKNKIINGVKGYTSSKYVLDNPEKNSIEGVLNIFTKDKRNYWVDITVSPAYQRYYEDFINFAVTKIRSEHEAAEIYVGVKEYHQAAKFMNDILPSHSFKLCGNFQILLKDYWMPIRDYKENKVPAIIFPDMTSPACNIIKFIS